LKRKDILETEQLNENPLIAALMGALVGMGLERNKAQKAAQQAVADAGASGGKTQTAQTASSSNGMLRKGSRGPEIEQLQRDLGMTGDKIDGIFGPATERAVRTFQQNSGIKVDGIVGPETRKRIAQYAASGEEEPAAGASQPAAGAEEPAAGAGEPSSRLDTKGATPRPNADQRDAGRERAAAAAPNNGAPQANPNRTAGAPSQLKLRNQILPDIDALLSQVTPGGR
jgi:peptidoglycan hydrolase-like protein with peptidoglycan-binding domain